MLWKLLKHECNATGRIMLPIWAALLVLAVFVNLTDRLFLTIDSVWMDVIAALVIMLFAIGCIAAGLMAVVTMVLRFQKSMLSREGYLTHTLPVGVHALIWSRLLAAVIFIVLTGVVIFVSFMISVAASGVTRDFIDVFRMMWQDIAGTGIHGVLYIIEFLLMVLVAGLSSCLMFYAAMSIGHSFANYKVLLSVVFYFVLYCGMQVLGLIFLVVMASSGLVQHMLDTPYMEQLFMDTHLLFILLIVMYLLISAVYYILTTLMLKRRLNLQ